MSDKVTIQVSDPMKIQRLRDRIAEDIARKYIHKFFMQNSNYSITKDDRQIEVSLEVINPIEDLMALFRRTKVKGWWEKYREGLLKVVKAVADMSVTPDLALILQTFVWKGTFPDWEECRCDVALVEVKRGQARLGYYQNKDVKKARKEGMPYYLLRVDDSDFLHGKFALTLEQLTPEAVLSVPK